MVEKAKYELDLIQRQCEDQEDREMQRMINNDILAIVELFASQGHSGFSATYAIPIINKLLKQSFILPLTGEDDEWAEVQPGVAIKIKGKVLYSKIKIDSMVKPTIFMVRLFLIMEERVTTIIETVM